jgi:hypothetical protein
MEFKWMYVIYFECFILYHIFCIFSDCGAVKKIVNGRVTLDKTKTSTYGATATLTCSPGYRLNQEKISCLDTGIWEKARCIIKGIV